MADPVGVLSPPESETPSPASSPPISINQSPVGILHGWCLAPESTVFDQGRAEPPPSVIGQSRVRDNTSQFAFPLQRILSSEGILQARFSQVGKPGDLLVRPMRSLLTELLVEMQEKHHSLIHPFFRKAPADSKYQRVLDYTTITGFDPTGRMQPLFDGFADFSDFETSYYQSGQASSANAASQQALSKLFDKYRDDPKSYPDRIGVEGISNYLTDLAVQPDEVVCIGLMEQLNAPTIGELHREGFINGWLNVPPPHGASFAPPCDTIPRQAAYMKQLRPQIQNDSSTFKKVYRYSFNICRPEGQKNVPAETATEMWRLFFSSENGGVEIDGTTPWLDWWIEFYETKYKRPVNKDLWNMFGEMVFKIQDEERKGGVKDSSDFKAGFDWWSEDGAWPGAIDDFVEWVVEKRKDGGAMDVS